MIYWITSMLNIRLQPNFRLLPEIICPALILCLFIYIRISFVKLALPSSCHTRTTVIYRVFKLWAHKRAANDAAQGAYWFFAKFACHPSPPPAKPFPANCSLETSSAACPSPLHPFPLATLGEGKPSQPWICNYGISPSMAMRLAVFMICTARTTGQHCHLHRLG